MRKFIGAFQHGTTGIHVEVEYTTHTRRLHFEVYDESAEADTELSKLIPVTKELLKLFQGKRFESMEVAEAWLCDGFDDFEGFDEV